METSIIDKYRNTADGQEAEAILRSCVHCGFCTATCPTYQLLGDERDGPRGRIYLVKQLLEGQPATARTLTHLDRCLSCRSCETTCPSGVNYARLADIGRTLMQQQVAYPPVEQLKRWLMRKIIPYPARFSALLALAGLAKPLLPAASKRKLPQISTARPWVDSTHARRFLVLEGCVQKAVTPSVNAATAQVLDRLGIRLERTPGGVCCGAVSYHNGQREEGYDFMRRNIDAWWSGLQQGVEGIIVSASGCGLMVKEYGEVLKHDPEYAEKAAFISAHTRDLSELIAGEDLARLAIDPAGEKIAFHAPCTLQHGQKLPGVVEGILQRLGFVLTQIQDAHLCCGSAGSYSLLQPELSTRLRDNKIAHIEAGGPRIIATANIGCQMHLATGTGLRVVHWIELLADRLGD